LIRVQDDGDGLPFEEAEGYFKSLGGSRKKKGAKTKDGRFIHGEKGQGRFKAFSLGETVTWISSANGKRFSITGQISNLKTFKVSDVFPTASKGCTVEISDVQKDFQIRGDVRLGKPSCDHQRERQPQGPTRLSLPTKISKTTPCKVAWWSLAWML
jgi:hypothetical protein